MPKSRSAAARLIVMFCTGACTLSFARAEDLYLEVFINGEATGMIGAFRKSDDGGLSVRPEELREVGIKPNRKATQADGSIRVDMLPEVEYRIDAEAQRLYISTIDEARAAKIVDINPRQEQARPKPQANFGAVLNYSLLAASNDLTNSGVQPFQGVSGSFDGRVFGPYGTFTQGFTANTSDSDLESAIRLNSTWSTSDTERMLTYRAGDFTSGSLPWTRSVYLGGVQVARNFSLRSDLVTLPVPVISGTAAVPSTLDVYTRNVKTYSGAVSSGPFEVANFPVISGEGEAQIVLTDALGRQTKTTLPFYSSSLLLRQDLLDFSAEIGAPRRNYGLESADYDSDIMGVATVRYGLTNWLTLEGHAEGGADLINGGLGASFPLASYGVASLAAAGSSHDGDSGMIVNASVQLSHDRYSVYARMQQAFGTYDDIASVTADDQLYYVYDESGVPVSSSRVPRSLVQISLSTPGPFERSNLNFSYTGQDYDTGDNSRIVSLSYSQPLFRDASFYATAYTDLEDNSVGLYAGLTIPFGNNINMSTSIEKTSSGMAGVVDISKSEQQEAGSYGWRLRDSEGATPDRYASASYRGSKARVEASVEQDGDAVRATAQLDGSIAIAGGGIFAANRIDDAFAVVNTGAPDVDVTSRNSLVGHTDGGGRILVPNLTSYEPNKISIDPTNLPADSSVDSTETTVVPADHSGVVVDFNVAKTSASALVGLVDAQGKALDAGLEGHVEGSDLVFVVGYDGEAYIAGLQAKNSIRIDLADGRSCHAAFNYQSKRGTQVKINNVVCS